MAMVSTEQLELDITTASVVQEYVDVFPEELSGLPPTRDMDFCIEVQLGTTSVA
jgi:hypothetical protein